MMIKFRGLVIAMGTCILTLTACGNTVYGPRRIVQGDYLDKGTRADLAYQCQQPGTGGPPHPTPTSTRNVGIDLPYDFNRLACLSINDRTNSAAAAAMMDSGFTLIRLRCNDFFAERAGHQTQARFWRQTVGPISAVIAGVIGLVNFKEGELADAVQILGISQAATIAGFELFEREFLFDSENVNAVRRLVMRALDAHAATALENPNTGFYHGARHLIDNQMVCTPANILEMVRTSIAEGEVRALEGAPIRPRLTSAADEVQELSIKNAAFALKAAALSEDQVGALWWLAQGGQSPDELAFITERLKDVATPPAGGAGPPTIAPAAQAAVTELIKALKGSTVAEFEKTKLALQAAIAGRAGNPIGDVTRGIHFILGPIGAGRSVEVKVTG